MTRKTVTTISCDICDRDGAKANTFLCDRRADGAGGMENIYAHFDLCVAHFNELVRKLGSPIDARRFRTDAICYGEKVVEWIEMQVEIWKNMPASDKETAIQILEL